MDLQLLIERMDVSTYQSLRDSLERGKWPDGQSLSTEQKALVMEALIRWGYQHLPEDQRIGYLPQPDCSSAPADLIPMKDEDGRL